MWPRNWSDAVGLLLCLALSPVLLAAMLGISLWPLAIWVAAVGVYSWVTRSES